MRFLMLVCRDSVPVQAPAGPAGQAVEQWVTAMDDRRVRVAGGELAPEAEAVAVRVRGGQRQVTDGAFLETKGAFLADVGCQVLIGRQELVPPRVGVAALTPREVGGEIFDMDLDPRSVGGELVQGHAPFFPDQDGLVAVGGQRGLDDLLVPLARSLGQDQQPSRGFASFYASGAFPAAGKEACAELAAQAEIALYLAHPPSETAGIGKGRPQVADAGAEAVLHAHDALAVC